MKSLDRDCWDNLLISLYGQNFKTKNQLIREIESRGYEFGRTSFYGITDDEMWKEYQDLKVKAKPLNSKMKDVANQLKSLAEDAEKCGVSLTDGGMEILEAIDACGWQASVLTTSC